MLAGTTREHAETFSFALAVVLTPAVVGYEVMRLVKATHEAAATGTALNLQGTLGLSFQGTGVAIVAGLIGLKWLSNWLESVKWYLFGIYCLVASGVVFYLHARGFSVTKMRSRSYECHTVTLCFQFRKNSASAFSASIAALHVYAPRRSCRPRCPVIVEAFPRGDERTGDQFLDVVRKK
jgi:hypothetical protein